ncbi:MAG: hypothetical protein AB8G95_23500 [Anaerolineae bacterium]
MAKSKADKKQRGREAREAKRKAEKQSKLVSRLLWIGLPTLLVVGLISWGIINQANQPPFDPLAGLRATNIQGNTDAPITILEFGDFG